MRSLLASLALHALGLYLLLDRALAPGLPPPAAPRVVDSEPAPMIVDVIDVSSRAGGSPGAAPTAARSTRIGSTRARSGDPWNGLSIKTEGRGDSSGDGGGNGTGYGNGIGFGNGGGVQAARDVPAPPPPPPVSKARPAQLIWPNRDVEVIDDSYLFVARVTVDADGSVVGARMLTARPGSRSEHAADAIWQFRYAPARDDAGEPIRSTFEQPFQVR